jgi:hypothetical protein
MRATMRWLEQIAGISRDISPERPRYRRRRASRAHEDDHDAEGRPDREALLALMLLDLVNANAPAKLRPALTLPAEQAA